MILAVGCLVDLQQRAPDSPDAERYHQFARAALCEIPVMEETNVETITALFYEIWYLLVFSDKKKAAGYAWGLMGLTAKLAQSVSFRGLLLFFFFHLLYFFRVLELMTYIFRRSDCVWVFPRFQMAISDGYRLLDRNGGNAKIIPEEVEKRRSLFWELLYLDARLVSRGF